MWKPVTCRKNMIDADLINMLCKPWYCKDVHKCLVSNSINIYLKYKNNLKLVTCRHKVPIHSAWSCHVWSRIHPSLMMSRVSAHITWLEDFFYLRVSCTMYRVSQKKVQQIIDIFKMVTHSSVVVSDIYNPYSSVWNFNSIIKRD